MIQCKCGWTGDRGDLCLNEKFKFTSLNLDIIIKPSNWTHCPKCNCVLQIPQTDLDISLEHSGSVARIYNIKQSHTTYLHLGRILDFNLTSSGITIEGYKRFLHSAFDRQTFCAGFPLSHEAKTLLKILSCVHKQHFKCEFKEYENLLLFGVWSKINKGNIYPTFPCSFCARIYELENNMENGWPFSNSNLKKTRLDKIRKLANVPIYTQNNKFRKIFSEMIPEDTTPKICYCNEISPSPNPDCEIHKEIKKD